MDNEFDPAAEFLAREQQELGDISQDLGLNGQDESSLNTNDWSFLPNNSTMQPSTQSQLSYRDSPRGFSSPLTTKQEEPETIRLWKQEFQERLAKKDTAEREANSLLQEQAQKELADWYKHNAHQNNKRSELNQENQVAFIAQRDENVPGAEWERVCRLCSFTPTNKASLVTSATSKDQNIATIGKDTSRYRNLLLKLKHTPPIR